MIQKEINTGNELIARFMGGKSRKIVFCMFSEDNYVTWSQLKYHCDWNLLMPVIEKIESYPMNGKSVTEYCKVYISKHNEIGKDFFYCNIFANEDLQFSNESKDSKIESIWKSVIEFIKWKNKLQL